MQFKISFSKIRLISRLEPRCEKQPTTDLVRACE